MTAQEEKKTKAIAKNMAKLSLDAGEISLPRVRQVLAAVKQNQPRYLKQVLAFYMRYLKKAYERSRAKIEFCGNANNGLFEPVLKTLNAHYDRKLQTEEVPNKDLIAGIRVFVGDDVWDYSVQNRLDRLKQQLF